MTSYGSPLLELIGDLQSLLEPDEFRIELLHALRRAVPADWVSINDIGPTPESTVVLADPTPPAELFELFARYIAFTLPHDKDRILGVALSRGERDFSDEERDLLEQARPVLIQAYRNAIRYTTALADRRRNEERHAMPNAERLVALGLTARQAEVLLLVATGAAEREIAARLEISHRTVEKHLERCYRRLGVNSRSLAASIAWATLDQERPSLLR